MPDLSEEAINQALRGQWGHPLRYFDAIGSTNIEALAWAAEAAPEGAVVVTDHQTLGRGRWGRTWASAPGALLQFSVVMRPKASVDSVGVLTAAVGVATARAIEEQVSAIRCGLKWPNDVIVADRKVAGILLESRVVGASFDAVVAGIGINVGWGQADLPSDIADTAGSLKMLDPAGNAPSRVALLACCLVQLEAACSGLGTEEGRRQVIGEASERSVVLGRDISIRLSNGVEMQGTAVELKPDGALRVQTESGLVDVHVGEVGRVREAAS
jgi:BirA family biotin operon repressor/biotin-[acetyl-CoA-carboxylase] ligase